MADYISTLTGSAMDAALLDMAEHNSEAFAVGERNGIAVTSDDVTYHNNARYYASQVQSIVPASVTEAVRWDVAQTALTDAQRLQGRENIKATSHNPNLLDNGFFTVNSRGQSSYTASAVMGVVDRWFISTNGSLTINSGYVAVTGAAGGVFGQYLNSLSIGTTYTASVKKSDGTISSITFSPVANTENIYSVAGIKLEVDTRTAYAAHPRFMLYDTAAWSANISAVKLELGSFSTLAEDTPPDYGEELTRCIYSTADPTDTYANNGFGRSNPNLIDNPWFTIQQRGTSAFTAQGYTADRWNKYQTYGIVTPSTSGLVINKNGDSYVELRSNYELDRFATSGNGKTFTISMMLSDGRIQSRQFTMASSSLDANVYFTFDATNDVRVNLFTNATVFCVRFVIYSSFTIRAVKLEQGTVSTLANDTPPDYGTELLKCQRYFWRLSNPSSGGATLTLTGFSGSATVTDLTVPTPVTMCKATPTVTFSGSLNIYNAAGNYYAVSAVSALNTLGNFVYLRFTNASKTSNEFARLSFGANAYIDFSADL